MIRFSCDKAKTRDVTMHQSIIIVTYAMLLRNIDWKVAMSVVLAIVFSLLHSFQLFF